MKGPSNRAFAILAAAGLALAACGSDGPPEDTPASPEPPGVSRTQPSTSLPPPAHSPATSPTRPAATEPTAPTPLALAEVAGGFDEPIFATAPPGNDERLYVVERDGRILVLDLSDGTVLATPFLDIRELTRTDGERGLLGLAFHPDYADNGRFVVHYSGAEDGDTRLAEYRVGPDGNRARPASARLLLTVEQPASNHNGGMVAFGPDGMLYLGLGDGGGAGDQFGTGQDPSTLLGTILRLDVDRRSSDRPYAIPPDNPFASGGEGAAEVWAYGLRNPWRFSFDDRADLLLIGDVGQNEREEIDVAPASASGLNYGWPLMEGRACYDPPEDCRREDLVLPALDYAREGGACGVIGGYVYRGEEVPGLGGTYFYGDLCDGSVRSFRYRIGDAGFELGGTVVDERRYDDVFGDLGRILSFGRDAAGELYVLTSAGTVYRIVAA